MANRCASSVRWLARSQLRFFSSWAIYSLLFTVLSVVWAASRLCSRRWEVCRIPRRRPQR